MIHTIKPGDLLEFKVADRGLWVSKEDIHREDMYPAKNYNKRIPPP
jgi:hypothetical protein